MAGEGICRYLLGAACYNRLHGAGHIAAETYSLAIESHGVRARSRGIALGPNAQFARSGTREAVNGITESRHYSQTGKQVTRGH